MRRLSFAFFLLFFLSLTAFSQSVDDKTWLTLSFDNNQYGSITRVPFDDLLSVDPISFSAGVERYLNASFNLEVTLSVGKVEDMGRVRANMFGLEVMPKYKLANGKLLKENFPIKPFLGLGVGIANYSDSQVDSENETALLLSPTVGLEVNVSPNAKLFVSTAYKISGEESISFRQYSIGFAFSLKKNVDSDGDGVPDKRDACPQEPGTKEHKGCAAPLVVDEPREVPAETNIQPEDRKETVKTDTTKTAETRETNQPEKPVDSDGDGIPDSADLCPNQPGTEVNVGCPVVEPTTPVRQPERSERGPVYELPIDVLSFDAGSDRIGQSGIDGLNALSALMQADESFKLKLNAYGDSGQEDAESLELAQKRAQAIKTFLVNKGRSPYRFIINAVGKPARSEQSGKVFIEVIE